MNIQHSIYQQQNDDYQIIEQAIRFLEENVQRQPELRQVAESVGLSEYHFQRLFTRWAGISPKRFLQYLTKENAKQLLQASSVLTATYSLGLSSPARLHDLFVSTEATTPGEFKSRGSGLLIRYAFHPSPFGEVLIGITGRGICHLAFVQASHAASLVNLKSEWANASFIEDAFATSPLVEPIFSLGNTSTPISLFVTGTNFQIKVWEALLSIPYGALTSYEEIAAKIGNPHAVRAVGTAVAHNSIAYLIPCHRVIRKMGEFGNYRYGTLRKKALHCWEAAQLEAV